MTESGVPSATVGRYLPRRLKNGVKRLLGLQASSAHQADIAFIRSCGLFDSDGYLKRYPDVASAGLDPVAHYARYGFAEGRDPCAMFSTRHYLAANPDVAAVGVNPFRHFCEFGWRELRDPSPDFDIVWHFLSTPELHAGEQNPLKHWLSSREKLKGGGTYRVVDLVKLLALGGDYLERAPDDSPMAMIIRDKLAHAGAGTGLAFDLRELSGFDVSAEAMRLAATMAAGSKQHYALGLVFLAQGYQREANAQFQAALDRSRVKTEGRRFGVGVLHELYGNHDSAAAAYEGMLKRRPQDAELCYRLARTYERLFRWSDAERNYERAIALHEGEQKPYWHARLGHTLERLERWDEAAAAYGAAILLSVSGDYPADWNYRLGYVLEKAERLDHACMAYAGHATFGVNDLALPESDVAGTARKVLGDYFARFDPERYLAQVGDDRILSLGHRLRGMIFADRGAWTDAAMAFDAALERTEDHVPARCNEAAKALAKVGRFQEACAYFRLAQRLQRPQCVPKEDMNLSPALITMAAYVEYSRALPICDTKILYESFSGLSMACNPLAIFRYLIEQPEFIGCTHVWVVSDPAKVPVEFRKRDDVIIVARESDGYLRHLATAKYLVNNSGFPPYFIRRAEQKNLETWHGTPLKTLGKEQKYKFYDHKRTQRNFLHATHIISPNPHTTDVQLDSYDIRPICTAKFAETGYPRIDLTLNASEARKRDLRARMGLSADKPVVLYAPTWRGTPDAVQFDFSQLQQDLERLGEQDCQLIFRGHSWFERAINGQSVDCHVVPADIDTNELLSIVDVLITDYSSVFFDFIPTGRPILYYIYDLEQYEAERGMYFDMMDMPGSKCRTIDELCQALGEALCGDDLDRVAYTAAQAIFNPHDDGKATERVVDFFFKDDITRVLDYRPTEKSKIVLYGGKFDEGQDTDRLIALANAIEADAYDVVLMFNPNNVETTPNGVERFSRLPKTIIGIPRHGYVPMTPEERWLRSRRESGRTLGGEEAITSVRHIYDREFSRMLPGLTPEAIVVIENADAFWPCVLLDNTLACKKIVLTPRGPFRGLDESVVTLPTSDSCEQDVASVLEQLGARQ